MPFKPVQRMMDSKIKPIHSLGHYIAYLLQYRTLYTTMVKNDLKGKFKYTSLGYLWYLLTPLSQIIIYILIFTVIFGKNIPNYWAYVSTGMFMFTLFSTSIAGGCNIITSKKSMITKMSFAREVLVFSKITSSLINLLISYVIIAIIMFIAGVPITVHILWAPVIVAMAAIFCIGAAFIMSSITVYVRDIANATAILIGCLMFALPIIYTTAQIPSKLVETLWHINPMFYYIESIHNCFYSGIPPDANYMIIGLISSVVTLIIGWCVFKKLEKGFSDRL